MITLKKSDQAQFTVSAGFPILLIEGLSNFECGAPIGLGQAVIQIHIHITFYNQAGSTNVVADLEGYPLWHAARAELLGRLDRFAEADIAYAAALAIPQDDAQLTHLRRRRARLADRTRIG